MTWHLLKRFDGEWSGWHLCSECFDDWRLKTVEAAMQGNAHIREPELLNDPGRWYEATEDDIAGTRLWELSCYGCGEYWPNDEVLREDIPDAGPVDIFDVVPAAQQPTVKYFTNRPSMDPATADTPPLKKKPKKDTDYFTQVLQAEMARARNIAPQAIGDIPEGDIPEDEVPW